MSEPNIDQLNTKIIPRVENGTLRAMDLHERAKLMRELYLELSGALTVATQEYIDQTLCRDQLLQFRELVRKYESFPSVIGECFMAIFLDWIEEKLK